MFLELISTAIFSAQKIQVKKIIFLPFWAVFAQNLGNFGKIFQKKFAPIFFSSFRTTGENFSQNGDPHVTPMVQSLIHPLLMSIHKLQALSFFIGVTVPNKHCPRGDKTLLGGIMTWESGL